MQEPDFMGMWSYPRQRNIQGVFFMHLDEVSNEGFVQGTIEDSLGTARFEGFIMEDRVSFEKTYLHMNKKLPAKTYLFNGKPVLTHQSVYYEGTYSFRQGKGIFILEEYVPSRTLDVWFRNIYKVNHPKRRRK